MAKVVVNFRVEQLELDAWDSSAGALGMSRSDWIRYRCGQPDYSPAGVSSQMARKTTLTAPLTAPSAWGTGDSTVPTGSIVFESEKPMARSRKELCPHRRKPDEYCVKCDG